MLDYPKVKFLYILSNIFEIWKIYSFKNIMCKFKPYYYKMFILNEPKTFILKHVYTQYKTENVWKITETTWLIKVWSSYVVYNFSHRLLILPGRHILEDLASDV